MFIVAYGIEGVILHHAVDQGWPTRGTRATSGTRVLSKWHAQLKLEK